MASTLLSQHSSNPLEATDSPSARRRSRVQLYLEAEARLSASSDDPLNGLLLPELQKYHNHLSQIIPDFHPTRSNQPTPRKAFVDLDEDMESEDELATAMQQEDEEANSECDDEEMRDSDAEGETDEEMTLYLKPPEEQHEIEEEIIDLEIAVPQLQGDYKIVDRLGTGTFSSVYKAIDVGYHDKWENIPWQGHHPSTSSAYYQSMPRLKDTKVFVAIKRIYVTSNPERIRNEISIMEDCRGCRHTSQLITAFRHLDQVVAIMPYHRNEDFREFYKAVSIQGIKAYFRCMFRALRDIHAREVIHRDVKPANFLFDPRTGLGTLCDFGLACRMEPSNGQCLHTFPTREHPHGRVRPRSDYNIEDVKRMQREARAKSSMASEKVGYPDKDGRPTSKANRAGTRGFRAPEVLLKCGEQTGAIDVWAAGIILLSFLTTKFPLLQSNDDIEALMEIATIIGRRKMEKAATLHSRTFATNVPTITQDGMTWREFIEKQNPDIYEPERPDSQYWPHNQILYNNRYSSTSKPEPLTREEHRAEIESALNLAERLMHPESVYRITPRDALYHPFLAEPGGEDDDAPIEDDEFVPHPFGRGACEEMHFKDEVTGAPCVRVSAGCECGTCDAAQRYGEVRTLVAGEGIAIGKQPCEFHSNEYW